MKPRVCELCNGEVSLYCSSDSAFLCWDCDARVHEANFLVARHVRRTVCSKCKDFDGNHISGVGFRPVSSICQLCTSVSLNDDCDSDSSTSFASSACLSSAESFASQAPKKKIRFDRTRPVKIVCLDSVSEVSGDDSCLPVKFSVEGLLKKSKNVKALKSRAPTNVDVKAEGILVNWCMKLGLKISFYVPLVTQAFGMCLTKLMVLPFRVSLASALWFSWKFCEGTPASTCQNLKRLEQISGVPAKLILFAESKLARVLKIKETQLDQEEGWAECSN
ncbi:B-box zinc finger protein 32-like [Telopea speciosissima]|uniref:B-box zinc finger protein 32-like n=1 Tax=Telopea speciosissima TaxID=54955 RepID=UPI001CC34704|nr:B-box zinc finger protein 32-like [Telopea speciosissima]